MNELKEGVNYNIEDDKFIFDFQVNHENSIIEFNDLPLEPVNCGINSVYYFGYQFNNNDAASSQVRAKFFQALRYGKTSLEHMDYHMFIVNALDKLHKQINIFNFDTFVIPESRSTMNAEIVRFIGNMIPKHRFNKITLLKNAPANISFNWEKWEAYIEMCQNNGTPKFVNDAAKRQAIKSIETLMDKIHKADYFSIAETVKKNQYKTFINDYLICPGKCINDVKTAKGIMIIDDVTTTGATIMEALKAIRCVNPDVPVVIFTVVGKKTIG